MIALWLTLVLVVFVFPIALLLVAFLGGGADDFEDVQRYIELTEEARGLVPPGLPLLDRQKAEATTAAIVRLEAKKEEARRALWASRDRRRAAEKAERQEARHERLPARGRRDRPGGGLVEQG